MMYRKWLKWDPEMGELKRNSKMKVRLSLDTVPSQMAFTLLLKPR